VALLMKNYKADESSHVSNNGNSMVPLRRGWTLKRLWILSFIGVAGLGLDVVFHTLDSGTPLTIIFDGADFSTGQMVLTSPPEIATLSWVGHITFLTAFALLIVLPKLFFESSQNLKGSNDRNWVVLKKGRSINQLWIIAMVGVAGMALDIAFHWLQDGSIDQVVLNGSDNPDPFVAALALTAHILFLTAFSLLIFLPKILFSTNRTQVPIMT
jgi:hypothetical protein